MKIPDENKLDNPVWHSLSESHEKFALNYDEIKFYNPDYCPFGGFTSNGNILEATNQYALICNNFFIVGENPKVSDSLRLTKELICLQMIVREKIQVTLENEIIKLTENHSNELIDLVNLVQPGYFKPKTFLLGDYFGIFKNGKLIAIAGERMKMNDFTEVSAILTHPEHTGKGYAKQLIAHVVNKILSEERIPFLHVVENNVGAIKLYEKLGFTTRRKMSFWNIVRL